MALINRFKLYLIKTYSKTPKNKKKVNVNKNNVEYILFALSEHHVTSHRVTFIL